MIKHKKLELFPNNFFYYNFKPLPRQLKVWLQISQFEQQFFFKFKIKKVWFCRHMICDWVWLWKWFEAIGRSINCRDGWIRGDGTRGKLRPREWNGLSVKMILQLNLQRKWRELYEWNINGGVLQFVFYAYSRKTGLHGWHQLGEFCLIYSHPHRAAGTFEDGRACYIYWKQIVDQNGQNVLWI